MICKGNFDDCLWSNGKSDTEKNHETIINKVRTALGWEWCLFINHKIAIVRGVFIWINERIRTYWQSFDIF